MSNLHILRETNILNIPATLREIADSIEKGEWGEVKGCVVVADGEELNVSYAGSGEAAPNAHLLLHAGAAKMMHAVMMVKGWRR